MIFKNVFSGVISILKTKTLKFSVPNVNNLKNISVSSQIKLLYWYRVFIIINWSIQQKLFRKYINKTLQWFQNYK